MTHISVRAFPLVLLACLAFAASAQDGPAVTGLTLVDAERDQEVGALEDGAIVDLEALGTGELSVVAHATSAGSVRFSVNDGELVQVESIAPYAIAGDENGQDFHPWTPDVGTYEVRVTPFTDRGADGAAGATHAVTFTIVREGGPDAQALQDPMMGIGRGTPEADADADASASNGARLAAAVPRQRFELRATDGGAVAGSLLLSDYGGHRTLVVSLSHVDGDGPFAAKLAPGRCGEDAAAATSLAPADGPARLGATRLDATLDELTSPVHHVRVFDGAEPVGTPLACGELEASALQ